MAARVTDLETGRSWELLATPGTDASRLWGAPCYRFRINHRPSAYITIAKPWISKHHGGIDYRDGRWWADDGGSINTVTVNGQRIDRVHPLANGDVLGFGETRLLFETDGGPTSCCVRELRRIARYVADFFAHALAEDRSDYATQYRAARLTADR